MKAKKLHLLNYCQHRDLTVEFDPDAGLVGIVGEMGAGKSNVVGAIAAAVSGNFDRNKKSRLVTLGEKVGSIDFNVEVEPGVNYSVFRSLNTSKATVVTPDDEISGADSVTQFLLDRLQVDQSVLQNIVFVRQTEISEILFCPPSERDRMASKFFGLEKAVALEKDISTRINGINLITLPESVAKIRQKIGFAFDREVIWSEELKRIGTPDIEELKSLETNLTLYLANNKESDDRKEYVRHRDELRAKIKTLNSTALEDSINAIPIDRLRSKLSEEQRKADLCTRRATLSKEKARFISEIERVGPSPVLAQEIQDLEIDIDRISRQESVNESAVTLRQQMLAKMRTGIAPICDTCNSQLLPTGVRDMQSLVDNDTSKKKDTARLASLRGSLSLMRQRLLEWEKRSSTPKTRLQEAIDEETSLGEDQGPGDPEKWKGMIDTYNGMTKKLASNQEELEDLQKTLDGLLEPDRSNQQVPEDFDPSAAQLRSLQIQTHIRNTQKAQEELVIAKTELELLNQSLERAMAIEAENSIQSALKVSLIRIRQQFHPDGAPRELIGRRIERMEHKINELLCAFDAKFTVSASGGFSFLAHFNNKAGSIEATELSGGEKIMLSICFRIACIQTFSSSVGLMVLDEPTVWLSKAGVASFKKVLDRMKSMSKELGFQFLIITHSDELLECFDQIINLDDHNNKPM